jgi:tetratricopeptide (TPR) repeat protein
MSNTHFRDRTQGYRLSHFALAVTISGIMTGLSWLSLLSPVLTLPMHNVYAQAKKGALDWIREGRQLWQRNDISGAIAAYQQASRLEPKNSRILTSIGFLMTQQSNYSGAIAALEQATKLDANNANAFNALGFVYTRIKDYPKALSAYRRVIAIDRQNINAYNSIGFLLTEQKNYAEAIKIYRQAIALAPRDPQSYLNLGYALKLSGNSKAAFEAYSQADQIAPFNVDVLVAVGGMFAEQNKLDEAVTKYKRALEINPRHPQANLAIANILQSQGDYNEAINFLRRAATTRNSTDAINIQRAIANIYLKQGSLSGAIVAYRQITDLNPDDAAAHLALGKILSSQQRYGEARRSLEYAEKIYNQQGDIEGLTQTRKALAELR